jgi:predicted nucleic acid-binding protein
MNGKSFLDTNVLVYAYDDHEPQKQAKARLLLQKVVQEHSASVSAQVLGEFFVVVTRRSRDPLTADQALALIEALSVLPVVELNLALVKRAIQLHRQFRISYWDALIIAAAERSDCDRVLFRRPEPRATLRSGCG